MSAILKRSAATAAALAVAMSGLFAVTAHADEPVYGNVKEQDATINIHKLEAGSLQNPANSNNTPAADGDGIKNVPFKLYKLKLDLTKTEDWTKLSQNSVVPEDVCNPQGVADFTKIAPLEAAENGESTATTGDGGLAVANVRTGAFLVCEMPAQNPTNAAGQPVQVVKKAKPFIVTVPAPHPNNNGWLYNVHVFPKNTVLEAPVKEMDVVSNGLGNADAVKIAIEGKVPNLASNEYFQHYSIIDPMPAELTNPTDYVVTVGGEQLVNSTHYTVDYDVARTNNMVSVNFTKVGLEKLKAKPNAPVKLTFSATMSTMPADGAIVNNGYVSTDKGTSEVPNDPGTPVDPPTTPGNPPVTTDPNNPPTPSRTTAGTTWAKVNIHKFDKENQDTKLEGAEFKIYLAANQDDTCTGVETTGDAITVNGKDVFTTGADGIAQIAGLFIDSQSVAAPGTPEPKTSRCFVVEEVKAPAGFILPQEPKKGVKAISTEANGVTVDYPNTRIPADAIPALPLTGASGQLIMMVLGSALMLASFGAFLVIRKRQAEQG